MPRVLPAPTVPSTAEAAIAISIARLHGEACITCGAVHKKLTPAGSVTIKTRTGQRSWPVVACSDCLPGDSR